MARGDRVVVLGCAHGGLAIARSLARRDAELLAVTHRPDEAGLASRYLRDWRRCPPPEDPVALVAFLLELGRSWTGALLYPTTDAFAAVVAEHADELTACFRLGVAPWEHARVFLEKDRTYALAAAVGVAHPRTFTPTSPADFEAQLSTIELPAMIKPVHSHRFVEAFGTKLFVADTAEALRADHQRAAGHEVVVSEVIPGEDYLNLETCQVHIDRHGELTGLFCCTKLRQTPPNYGVIRVGKSIEATDELVEPTLRLLRHLDYRGYASAEFKRDPRDGVLKLIEVNIRPLRMSRFAIECGVDFPAMMLDDVMGRPIEPTTSFRVGSYYLDLISDVGDLVRFRDERRLSRLFEPYGAHHKIEPLLALRDPKPFFRDVSRRIRKPRARIGANRTP